MYKRIHTPNSPLLPLTPLVETSAKVFLSPKETRGRLRRSFTPMMATRFCCSPPSISPIHSNIQINGSSIKFNENLKTPSKKLNYSSISKSANASMKLLRSSARYSSLCLFMLHTIFGLMDPGCSNTFCFIFFYEILFCTHIQPFISLSTI